MNEEKLLENSLLYFAKYPFLPNAKKYVSSYNLKIKDLENPFYKNILQNAKNKIKEAYLYGLTNVSKNFEVEVLSYPFSIAILSMINNPSLSKRFATAEKERVKFFLEYENNKIIECIGKKIGLDIIYEPEEKYDFKMNVFQYIQFSSKMNKPEWKLTNRILYHGKVYLERNEAIEIIGKKIEEYVLQKINEKKEIEKPDFLKETINEIETLIKEEESGVVSKIDIENLPPCIKLIYKKIYSGENVSHFERFTLVSFLVNIGFEIEKIVSLFSNLRDFDERITKYQIEHIAGIKGGKTKYKMPSCKTLKTHGICIQNCRINFPLNYLKKVRSE